MAEDEKHWRRNHAHESSIVTYGSNGTATYDESSQSWHFQRKQWNNDKDEQPILRALGEPQILFQTEPDTSATKSTAKRQLTKCHPQLAAARDDLSGSASIDSRINDHPVSPLAFGNARWLGTDGQDSGNNKYPVTAFIAGRHRDELVLTCVGREYIDYQGQDGIPLPLRIPAFMGEIRSHWKSNHTIDQVTFASASSPAHEHASFLAIRQTSGTSILEPLLRRAPDHANLRSSLDTNTLLKIGRRHTGGFDHADICFNPVNQRQVAIVDVQGNWSLWEIHGQMSYTARRLYKAHLLTSGKIFSWSYKVKPPQFGLYFDGWHKIIMLSRENSAVDTILLCNRHHAKVFDVEGNVRCWVDVRIDTQKADAYILDVRLGPRLHIVFILTTSSVLVVDFARTEWKDAGQSEAPMLVVQIPHFRVGLDLKLCQLSPSQDRSLVAVYGENETTLHFWLIEFAGQGESSTTTVSGPLPLELPGIPPESVISSVQLVQIASEPQTGCLCKLIISFQDGSISSTLIDVHNIMSSQYTVPLPPPRNLRLNSQRVIESDEDDVLDFITDDHESEEEAIVPGSNVLKLDATLTKRTIFVATDTLASSLEAMFNATEPVHLKRGVPDLLQSFSDQLEDSAIPDGVSILSDLFDKHRKVEDIELDSALVERAMHSFSMSDRLEMISTARGSQSLLDIYSSMFEDQVSVLDQGIADAVRIRRERTIRNIALDLYLSQRMIQSVDNQPHSEQKQKLSSQIEMFSDPLMPYDGRSQVVDMISASQPVPGSANNIKPVVKSPIPDVLASLSAFSQITRPPDATFINDDATSKHLTSLLSHLPDSLDEDPNAYDWQASEITAARLIGEAPAETKTKRSEKLAKARKRAENITLPIMPRRNVPARQAETQDPILVAQSEGNHHSSQPLVSKTTTSTQPERGAFGSRSAQNTIKPKKKRRAGF